MIFVLFFILGLTVSLVWIIDIFCFIIFYHSMTNGDIRKWNDNVFSSPYSREFYIIEKGLLITKISNRYESTTVPTKWIFRESYLSIKNILG